MLSGLFAVGNDSSENILKGLLKYLIQNVSRESSKNYIDDFFINSAVSLKLVKLLITAAKMNVRR